MTFGTTSGTLAATFPVSPKVVTLAARVAEPEVVAKVVGLVARLGEQASVMMRVAGVAMVVEVVGK